MTVGVTTVMMTTLSTHPVVALAAGAAFLAVGMPPGAGMPLSTVAMFSTYAIPAYSPYVNHLLHVGPVPAHLARPSLRRPASDDAAIVHTGSSIGFAAGASVGTPDTGAMGHHKQADWDTQAGTDG